ncbi:MAG: hypothetical protein WCD79_08665 [Chthoniobacteraceae bacterium]
MKRHLSFPLLLLLSMLIAATAGSLFAADPPSPREQRLAEAMRATMLQLRDAQNQLAALQASQAESDDKNKALTTQVEELTKQWTSDKEVSEKTITDLKSKLSDREARVAKLTDSLEKWQKSEKEAADVAHAKEAERAKLAMQVIVLQRLVADRETKNMELFKVGNEILLRYEKYSLGQALLAKEPFTGIARVKLESQVQDYQDKLLDQKIIPGSTPPNIPTK